MNLTKKLAPWLLLGIFTPALTGCFGVAAVGLGASALMASDRRVSETYLADEGIEIRATNRVREKFGDKVHINTTSYNRTLLLTGEAPDEAMRDAIEKTAVTVNEVRRVQNEIQISAPSSFAARSSDTYLTSKVKARFLDANKFPINHVKIITESSTVYLLGLVTQREADAAIEIARTTGGVQRVVRVFEVISDAEALRIDGPPRKEEPPTNAPKK